MIVMHAFFKVDSKYRKEFIEQVKLVSAPSQSEEGNISYHLYEDTEQPNTFVFIEKWKDQEAVDYHGETTHVIKFIENVFDLLIEPFHVEAYEISENSR